MKSSPQVTLANRAYQKLCAHFGEAIGILSNDQLLKVGQTLWPLTYKLYPDDDDAALEALIEHISSNPDTAFFAEALMHIPHEQLKVMWISRWVDQGCPRVILDDRFASLLMSTDAGPEVASLVVPPWKAFLIEIPEGLLTSFNVKTGKESSLRRIFVHQVCNKDGEKVWNFIAEANDGLQLWRHGFSTEGCLVFNRKEDTVDWGVASFTESIETQDERVILLLGRLIVSTCLSLSDPTNYHEQKKSKGRGNRWRLDRSVPEVRTFVLGKPVTIDCRPSIRNFIQGQRQAVGSRLTVQFFVRGHWKNQPHGPNRALRKLIHIEPYWKGPEDAKIVTRTINLTSRE